MAKRKASRSSARVSHSRAARGWGGFTPFQLIVIFSVFIVLAIFYLM